MKRKNMMKIFVKAVQRKIYKLIKAIRSNIENAKAMIFLTTLILLLLIKLCTLHDIDPAEDIQDGTTIKEINRVDITHTYKQLDDNTYKIYPAYISYVSDKDGELYMEYLKTELKYYSTYMEYTDKRFSETSSVSEILQIPYSAHILIEIDGKTEDISVATFIKKWSSIRELCLDKPEDTSSYLMEFIVKDQEITKVSIRNFNWEDQNVEVEYPLEYARDYPVIEDEEIEEE